MKLEDILEKKLPVYINETAINKEVQKFYIPKLLTPDEFINEFGGSKFSGPELLEVLCLSESEVGDYGLIMRDGKFTLDLKEAIKLTPNLHVPYLEFNAYSKESGAPVIIFLTITEDHSLTTYTPLRGSTLRTDTYRTLENSGIHDFDWENKEILEKSDLLYIMKDVNRPALSKYLLKDIYEAFQEYRIGDIVIPNRDLCLQEFESKVKLE